MPAIPSTQLSLEFNDKRYSGVFSVSGNTMIARIPGIGSKSCELADDADPNSCARALLERILEEVGEAPGRPS